jgi:ribosomal protein S18 acetylase RimI-like enzyme
VLFVQRGEGWRYYARPLPGGPAGTADDVRAVVARQRELGQPRSFEWVGDCAPWLWDAAVEAGLETSQHPLLVLDRLRAVPRPDGIDVRMLTSDDDLRATGAVQEIGFSNPGTVVGSAGVSGLDEAAQIKSPGRQEFERRRIADGLLRVAAAYEEGVPVCAGAHQPVDGVSEVVGVATLPTHRRRGLAAAVTAVLVGDAVERGVDLVWLSAADDDVARVYERVGFVRTGMACEAEAPV